MNKEFHYWVTGIIAEYSGFPPAECRTIAYSSQYTDDNNYQIEVFDDEFDVSPSYISHVSQTEDITQPQAEIMKIYPLFHFIPGDKTSASPRKDTKTHSLLTTPDSSYAKSIIQFTLQNAVSRYKAKDKSCLFRIGIAAHCYVDTWAHQNFIGWFDDMNGLPGVHLPNIGHFDAKHDPDLVHHTWSDERLITETINNNERFIFAAERLYEHLTWFCQQVNLAPRGSWEQLHKFLNSVWDGENDMDSRISIYRKHSKVMKDYDDRVLEAGAFTIINVPDPAMNNGLEKKCVWRTDIKKANTDWFKFQEAVKGHIVDASTILRPAFLDAKVYI